MTEGFSGNISAGSVQCALHDNARVFVMVGHEVHLDVQAVGRSYPAFCSLVFITKHTHLTLWNFQEQRRHLASRLLRGAPASLTRTSHVRNLTLFFDGSRSGREFQNPKGPFLTNTFHRKAAVARDEDILLDWDFVVILLWVIVTHACRPESIRRCAGEEEDVCVWGGSSGASGKDRSSVHIFFLSAREPFSTIRVFFRSEDKCLAG